MATSFELQISADTQSGRIEFRLLDDGGSHLGWRQIDFGALPLSRRHSLVDLRGYLRHYVPAGREDEEIARVGVAIAEDLLGQEIFEPLWRPQNPRTLLIRLPGAAETDNHLAAALARVPWEIGRPQADKPTLSDHNLLVRVAHRMAGPDSQPLELSGGEELRVLFVFAEARGSNPLGMRQERRELLRLFEREIYPSRRVVAHVLSHGVTRERLREQIESWKGYHVVHWSGHGHTNLLELAKSGGAADHLRGEELLKLFHQAGGLMPRLVFLSACHSGDIAVKSWSDFLTVARGGEPETIEAANNDLDLRKEPGFTGTAHALLQGGVTSVVAMRYAVGDDYARELASEFYRALLAHQQPRNATEALSRARQALLDPERHDVERFAACDHATPLLYGEADPALQLAPGKSSATTRRQPRLHAIAELTLREHPHFVGRTWQLAELGAEWLGASQAADTRPVAVVVGLGGMGKTALTAEILDLWEDRFDWILLYQAKPSALGFDATLRDIDLKLRGELGAYHDHVKQRPADAIYRDPSADFKGPERHERLSRNLVQAMQNERILLVLDNFETCLKPQAAGGDSPARVCQDPAWDACLAQLATELVGSGSRVLVTSRAPLACLVKSGYVVNLGPLPAGEATLFLKGHPVLVAMIYGDDAAESALAYRLLSASRFHPLLLDRLARLASSPALRPQLLAALEALEKTKNFAQLPFLFATKAGDAAEQAYLHDALEASIDLLIRDASPDARRLLWIIAVANQPEGLDSVRHVWSGERPDPAPLLAHLVGVGLVTEERSGPDDDNPNLACHELVRERIRSFMEQHPPERSTLSETGIRIAYADRLAAAFESLMHQNMTLALEAGSRALVYCVEAAAWDRLGNFAGQVVTSAQDPRQLAALLPHLQSAAEAAPEGRPRWSCLTYLADAVEGAGLPERSLSFYEQAASLARAEAEAGGEGARQAWRDLAAIVGNWANALGDVGQPGAARERQLEAAEAARRAGSPAINILARDLEALRIDIRQGNAAAALPEVETRLAQIETWWRQHRSGKAVAEAPNAEFLARALVSALDIAKDAHFAQKNWQAALPRIDAMLEVERALKRPAEDMAATRMNRANVLVELGRFGEAKTEMEACLPLFQHDPAGSSKVLGSLADLLNQQGDVAQAILQERRALSLRDQLPDPADRAISHNNLANYLTSSGSPAALAESRRHQLAALCYRLVAELGQHLQDSLHNYTIDFRRARAAGTPLEVPRLAEVLDDPAFAPLRSWLQLREVDPAELQEAIDGILEQVRQHALSTE